MVDFKKIEQKWQKKWQAKKVFEADPGDKPKFYLTVPYPYTSGPLHVGHGRTYTLGDITAKFLRMRGLNVLWPMAFHITGTPILSISKRIENGEENVIKDHIDYVSLHSPKNAKKIVDGFVNPENVANYYASVISKDLNEFGCSIDWRRDFTTGDKIYNKFIQWQYYHLSSLGYLKKGEHPVFYCPSDQNPVTTDDVKGGDELEMGIGEFFLLKEKFEDGYLVAATLRPETIFGVVNVWVNPEKKYVKVRVRDEVWYVSEKCAQKLKDQNVSVEVVEKFDGRKLIGREVFIPLAERSVLILPATFVDDDVATGVVNSVPAHAPYDFVALEELKKDEETLKKFELDVDAVKKIVPISLIKVEGFSADPAVDVVNKMGIKSQSEIDNLEKATQEVYSIEYYNGVLRENCGDLAGIKVSDAKQKIYEKLRKKNFVEKMFESMVKGADGNIVKEVKCRCGTRVVVKLLKDQWFLDYANEKWKESARRLLSKMEILPEMYRKQFEGAISWLHEWACARNRGLGTRLPYDERWIIESLSDSTIYMAFYTIIHQLKKNKIKPEKLTKEFFDYVFLGSGNEGKISKETKIKLELLKKMREEFLYWYPMDERRTAPAHIPNHLTFSIFHHAAIFPENLWPKRISINELLIAEGRKMSKSLGNVIPLTKAVRMYGADTVRVYLASATDSNSTLDWREKDVEVTKKRIERLYEIFSEINKFKPKKVHKSRLSEWFVSKFYDNLKNATESLQRYQFKQYTQKMFIDTLSDVEHFMQRSGDFDAIKKILSDWVLSLTPAMPHVCEEMWSEIGDKSFAVDAAWPSVKEEKIDKEVLELEFIFRKTIEDLSHVTKLAGKKEKCYLYVVTDKELDYLSESLDFIKRQFVFGDIRIFKVSDKDKYDPQNKAQKAKYGKPGIFLE